MDTASHITQLRIDNMYRGAGMQGQAPRLAETGPAPLLDPKTLLEHVSLQKSMSNVGRRKKRGKDQSSSNNHSDQPKADTNTQHPKPSQRKGFPAGQSHDKGKSNASSNSQSSP
jgi:hypothetical protein